MKRAARSGRRPGPRPHAACYLTLRTEAASLCCGGRWNDGNPRGADRSRDRARTWNSGPLPACALRDGAPPGRTLPAGTSRGRSWPAGLLAAALGAGWVVNVARFRAKIERLVSTRTGELSEMNERFRREAAERDGAQSSLGAHHSLLQAVIDASPTLTFIKDRDGIWILANQTMADIHGLTAQQIVGMTHQQMGRRLGLPQAEVERFLEDDQRVIDSGESMFIAEEPATTHGPTRWLQTTKVPIHVEGRGRCVLGVSSTSPSGGRSRRSCSVPSWPPRPRVGPRANSSRT